MCKELGKGLCKELCKEMTRVVQRVMCKGMCKELCKELCKAVCKGLQWWRRRHFAAFSRLDIAVAAGSDDLASALCGYPYHKSFEK